MDHFRCVVQLDPNDGAAHRNMAEAMESPGELAQTLHLFDDQRQVDAVCPRPEQIAPQRPDASGTDREIADQATTANPRHVQSTARCRTSQGGLQSYMPVVISGSSLVGRIDSIDGTVVGVILTGVLINGRPAAEPMRKYWLRAEYYTATRWNWS